MLKTIFLFSMIFLFTNQTSLCAKERLETPREYAVALAKRGRMVNALKILALEYERNPNDVAVVSDYIVLLTWAEKWQKAVNIYEENNGIIFPSYVDPEIARAYRFTKNYDKAAQIYSKNINRTDNQDSRIGLFYTALEMGDYDKALNYAQDLQDRFPDDPQFYVLKSQVYIEQNKLDLAQQQLEYSLQKFPDNIRIKSLLAQVVIWRGHKRKALSLYEKIIDSEDDYLTIQNGYANALFLNMERQKAWERIRSLRRQYPENSAFKLTEKNFRLSLKPFLTSRTIYNHELPGEDEFMLSGRIDMPVSDHNTLFVQFVRRVITQLDNNDITKKNYFGDTWQPNNFWRLTGAFHIDTDNAGRAGGFGEIAFMPDDYWTFTAFHDSRIIDVPLRSKQEGTDVDQTVLSISFRLSEKFITTAGSDYRSFSDGNNSLSHFWYTDSLISTFRDWKLRIGSEAYITRNSRQDVSYFSPKETISAFLIPTIEHIWARGSDYFFMDRLSVGAGQIWQTDFGGNNGGFIRYEQDHSIRDNLSLVLGTIYSLHSYDDDDVNKWGGYINIRKRF